MRERLPWTREEKIGAVIGVIVAVLLLVAIFLCS